MKRFSLSRRESIKSSKVFTELFTTGKTVVSKDRMVRAVFLSERVEENSGVYFAAAVSRKAGNAVWRNRMKRLLRDAYRRNKLELHELADAESLRVFLVLSPFSVNKKKNRRISLQLVEPGVVHCISRIRKMLN